MEETYQLLLNNPNLELNGFKLINIFLSKYEPPIEHIENLISKGVNISPMVCVVNLRYNIIEYLIERGKLNPNEFIFDLCMYSKPGFPTEFFETLKVFILKGCNLNLIDENGRTPYDCLSMNRAYKYLAPYLKNNGKKLFDELAENN